MTGTVLLPLDGSSKDSRAVPVAGAFADLTDAAIHLIQVLQPPDDTLVPRAQALGVADVMHDDRERIEQSIRATADRVAADSGRRVTTEVADGSDIALTLLSRVADSDTDVVVMATRAPTELRRAVRESVADRVMRESPRPVVLVPPVSDESAGKRMTLRRVLVPLDGSSLALRAIDQLVALPHASDLEYVLLAVIPPSLTTVATTPDSPAWAASMASPEAYVLSAEAAQQARDVAEGWLNTLAKRLHALGAKVVDVRVVEGVDPAGAIDAAARAERADFIAMSTHGVGGLRRVMLGSVADTVVRKSAVPVFLVTPAVKSESAA